MTAADSKSALEAVERRVALITVITPFLAVLLAVILMWGRGVSWLDLLLCAGMYVITMLGITLGFHRLFTHRSFKCVAPISALLGVAGCMAAQGPILFWTSSHRRHHQCSDDDGDPHSPKNLTGGFKGLLRGWWHAHTGWMLTNKVSHRRGVADLMRIPQVVTIDRNYFLWIALGLVLPAILGGAITRSWSGFFTGMLWGGFVRLFLVHHSTWSINSICHLFGTAPFQTGDESRNNGVCAVLTFGEGWHNNHHAFPSSARHGLHWWEVDFVYLIVRGLALVGLAWDVRLPDRGELTERRKTDSLTTASGH